MIFNNKLVVIPPQYGTIMFVCEKLGIDLPRFCYHDKLAIAGNCRMCLVEIEGSVKPVIGCAYETENRKQIYTESYSVKQVQECVLEFLLINHPLDCPICDQGGECDLQDLTFQYGNDRSRFFFQKRYVKDKNFGPFVKTSMNRCIHCTRCIRFLEEIGRISMLGALGRGSSVEIGLYNEKMIFSEVSGNLVDICPVGFLEVSF